MAQNLTEYLAGRKCQGFKAVPHYFPGGDFVTCYFSNEECFEQRVDDLLTVYLSMDTKELVGCKITGVKHVLQTAADFGVTGTEGDVRWVCSSSSVRRWPKTMSKRDAMRS